MNITSLEKGQSSHITSLINMDPSFRKRIMDLGVYEGASIVLLNVLNGGNLYLLEVDDIEICIRKEDALLIEVEK